MAALGCTVRRASRNFTMHFSFNPFTRRFFSSKHKYLKKFKNRRNPKISDFDVQEVLLRGKTEQGSVVMSGGTAQGMEATSKTAPTNPKNSWKHSNERLGFLKTAEKRVAVVAVLTMLLGYFAIKWMVSAPSSKEGQEEEKSDSVSADESPVQPMTQPTST